VFINVEECITISSQPTLLGRIVPHIECLMMLFYYDEGNVFCFANIFAQGVPAAQMCVAIPAGSWVEAGLS
jgi:hypothetical protein